MEKAIIVKNVSKKYKLYNGMKERILDLVVPKSYGKNFYALQDVNFEAEKGDAVGFIGINGSGKSTLSNIVAGIVPETTGTIDVNGQVSLIAVAAGLKGDLTGRDNIKLKCLMLGFNKEEIKELEPEIIEFSELDNFIDQPVKSYSSGMKSRLGFAISVNIDPDVLIIDEALSVGDKAFSEKSLNKMKEFKEKGKTMIFVSHSIGQMKQFCDKILWLEYGKVKDYGTVEEIIPKYEDFLSKWKKMSKKERQAYKNNVIENNLSNDLIGESEQNEDNLKTANVANYIEEPISRIGHIRGGESFIYTKPYNVNEYQSTEAFKDSAYYIKRQAIYREEYFYLLSNEPSAETGVIGWMKESDISSRLDVVIDNDPKSFYIKGVGAGYNRPWGGKKNRIVHDLKSAENSEFKVSKTEKVGNNLWYRGMLSDQQIWVHHSRVMDLDENPSY